MTSARRKDKKEELPEPRNQAPAFLDTLSLCRSSAGYLGRFSSGTKEQFRELR